MCQASDAEAPALAFCVAPFGAEPQAADTLALAEAVFQASPAETDALALSPVLASQVGEARAQLPSGDGVDAGSQASQAEADALACCPPLAGCGPQAADALAFCSALAAPVGEARAQLPSGAGADQVYQASQAEADALACWPPSAGAEPQAADALAFCSALAAQVVEARAQLPSGDGADAVSHAFHAVADALACCAAPPAKDEAPAPALFACAAGEGAFRGAGPAPAADAACPAPAASAEALARKLSLAAAAVLQALHAAEQPG